MDVRKASESLGIEGVILDLVLPKLEGFAVVDGFEAHDWLDAHFGLVRTTKA